MAAFLGGSNVQADSIQTLHLMNTGYGTCTDAAAIGQNDSDTSHACAGYAMPASMVSQSFLSQQSTLAAAMYGSQQHPLAMANRASPYTWTSSNEVSFVPSNDTTQPLASKYVSMTSNEQQFSEFSMVRQADQDGASLGLHAPHALSLSLSPQRHPLQSMPYYTSIQSDGATLIPDLTYVVGDKGGSFKGDRIPNLAHLRTSSTDVAPATLHNRFNNMSTGNAYAQAEVSSATGGFFTGSKYLNAVQHLLNEVVSVEDAIKKASPSSKNAKSQMWNTHGGSFVAATAGLGKGTESLNGHNSPGDTFGLTKGMAEAGLAAREGISWGLSIAKAVSFPDAATSAALDLTPQSRQELQMKKAKLIAMLEEVDRRYKLYRSQMQAIVSLFESASGVGSAQCYTALALQTISRHFRCLRDAIANQLRAASKGLGEEDHFSQHRVLQQLHMMQQHAWRPQRGLPERAVSVLRAWLFEHFLHPYPKDADKIMLAKQTGLTRNQVSNWFINARVRLWKPMVEEMYQEEAKDTDGNPRSHETEEEGEESRGSGAGRDARGSTGGSPSQLLANPSSDRGTEEGGETLATQLHYRPPTSTTHNSTLEAMVCVDPIHDAKKARSSLESITARSAGVYSNLCDLKGGDGNKLSFAYGPFYTDAPAGGIGRNSSFGALQGSNAISLTLGLQHSDPLEAQHDQTHQPLQYIQHLNEAAASHSHGHNTMHAIPQQLADGLLDRGNSDPIDITTQNYYSSMAAVANLSTNGYEILSQLQNPKEYVGHVLHPDFSS